DGRRPVEGHLDARRRAVHEWNDPTTAGTGRGATTDVPAGPLQQAGGGSRPLPEAPGLPRQSCATAPAAHADRAARAVRCCGRGRSVERAVKIHPPRAKTVSVVA